MKTSATSLNYGKDRIDLEFAVSDFSSDVTRTHLSIEGPTRRVSGIQRTVQRYINLLLTDLGSIPMDPEAGTDLYRDLRGGYVNSSSDLGHLFAISNDAVLGAMRASNDEMDEDDVGESIADVTLNDVEVDSESGTALIDVTITTTLGESFRVVAPAR